MAPYPVAVVAVMPGKGWAIIMNMWRNRNVYTILV
jgi:hypothetical protein